MIDEHELTEIRFTTDTERVQSINGGPPSVIHGLSSFTARCRCGWLGVDSSREGIERLHRVHVMEFIDGSAEVVCCFCGDEVPASAAEQLVSVQDGGLKWICTACRDERAPVDLDFVRRDLQALERELRTCP